MLRSLRLKNENKGPCAPAHGIVHCEARMLPELFLRPNARVKINIYDTQSTKVLGPPAKRENAKANNVPNKDETRKNFPISLISFSAQAK